jgi:hypothetical protein
MLILTAILYSSMANDLPVGLLVYCWSGPVSVVSASTFFFPTSCGRGRGRGRGRERQGEAATAKSSVRKLAAHTSPKALQFGREWGRGFLRDEDHLIGSAPSHIVKDLESLSRVSRRS